MAPRRDPRPATPAPTREERRERGQSLRAQVPRSAHGRWAPPRDRPDPVDLLREADRGRLPALLPIRYGRMSLSPLAFLRGAASLMAHDLADSPVTGLRVQLGGDAHLSNFGIFGTPERNEVFDLNDFDETLPGPWEWDLKRLVASLVVAGRAVGLARASGHRAALRAARSYRELMNRYAGMRYLDIWYSHLDPERIARLVARPARKAAGQYARKARGRTALDVFPRLARRVAGGFRIRDQPPLLVHYSSREATELTNALFERYLATVPEDRRMLLDRYHVADVAQKVVGVGSVGTRCSILLLVGDRDTEDPLLLQVKEALASAWEPYAGASIYPCHAQRVVVGQHLIQESSDSFLGFGTVRGHDLYVRQLRDWKFFADPATMGPKSLLAHGELCGAALARAHARTGDPAAIAGYLGTKDSFDRAVAAFAEVYADQNDRDYRAFLRAIRRGRIMARSGG